MKSVVEPLEGNKVKLSVEVDEQEFEKAVDAAYKKFAGQVRLPGFRPGKAPRKLLEARLGPAVVREEALRDALPTYYAQALKESDVDAIAPPQIDITSGQEAGPLAFDAVVEVRPQIQVPGYGGLRVTIPGIEVSDEDVDRQVDRLRKQSGELSTVERPAQDGDHVTIDLSGERGGEPMPGLSADDYLYEVGSAGIVPELDEQLVGAKTGDILTFDAQVPEGDPISFRVLVKEVKEQVLPEVTDEWASEASEFDTVAELRADFAERMKTVRKVQASLALRDEALKALVELVADEPPQALVDAEVERRVQDLAQRLGAQGATIEQYLQSQGITVEQFVEDAKAGAVDSVKADLALRAVAEAEDLQATDEDVETELERLAEQLRLSTKEVRRRLERADQMQAVTSDVRRGKALAWILDHVEIVDEEGRIIDRSELQPNPRIDADDEVPAEETEA